MDNDFDMNEEKLRVLNVDDDLNLNEGIKVSSGFDLGAQESKIEEIRVSNEGSNVDDLNLEEEIDVSSGFDLAAPKREIEEIMVLDGGSNVVDLNLNEESGVSSGFDLGAQESEIEEISVSNEGSNVVDLNLNEDIRVSSGFDLYAPKSKIEEVRVLPGEESEGGVLGGYLPNGESEEVSIDGDGEIVTKGENLELRNVESSDYETGKPETSGASRMEDSTEFEMVENDMYKPEVSGSGRMGKSVFSSSSEGDSEESSKFVGEVEGSLMDGRDEELKLESQGDFGASQSKKVVGIEIDRSVMRSLSAKVLGTEFEMGDMVWGKVKSHPWWPGHLYNEVFASSSVRRSRRDGHILIAFFGDSSYGWFYPDELIPYDPHYPEKSLQSSSKNFVRAVEESVDEASRRSALGLSCYCRNPNNFRPTDIPGYLSVDIVDFEPGSVYSVSQIQKARDNFHPDETLSFIHQFAIAPMDSDSKCLDFLKNMAIALAYRRSVFEEFDETYSEAFGHKPAQPQLADTSTIKEPSRVPLSGPLVFADTLGVRKSSAKATRPKERSKKDKYLLKRRDEPNDLKTVAITQAHSSPSSSAYDDGYVFQKRDQTASNNVIVESPAVEQLAISEDTPTTGRVLTSVPQRSVAEETGIADLVDARTVSVEPINIVTSSDAGNLTTGGALLKKKKKSVKHPASELSSGKSEPQEKKLKKLRRLENVRGSEHLERHSAVSTTDDTQGSHLKKNVEATDTVPQQVGLVPMSTDWENETDVSQVLDDLLILALNPFHGMKRNGLTIARQFLLKFRFSVFLKSSCASITAESEHGEAADKLPSGNSKSASYLKKSKVLGRQDDPTKGGWKQVPSERQEENAAKRAKKITDVKSLSSEKRTLLKNAESEQADKKFKVTLSQTSQSKPSKGVQQGKKTDRPSKVGEPTYLVMKYQPGSTLPSLMELKARFTRFGPLDISLNRVFYKTYTCRVAFLCKQDANVAYRYAVGSKSLFSNVRFMLKPVMEPESQPSVKTKDLNSEPGFNRDPSARPAARHTLAALPQPIHPLKSCLKKPSGADESNAPNNGGGSSRMARVRFNMGVESSSGSNKIGGVQVQLMESRNQVLSSNKGASSSSFAIDVNSNNQRLLSSLPSQPPLLPLAHFVRPPINHHSEVPPRNYFHENLVNATMTNTSLPSVSQALPPPPSVDVTQQMMSLLTKCHDVVNSVKGVLGYVPYHSL